MTMRNAAYAFLCWEIKRSRIALGRAERKAGVTQEEIDNIQSRIELLEWISARVLEVEEDE